MAYLSAFAINSVSRGPQLWFSTPQEPQYSGRDWVLPTTPGCEPTQSVVQGKAILCEGTALARGESCGPKHFIARYAGNAMVRRRDDNYLFYLYLRGARGRQALQVSIIEAHRAILPQAGFERGSKGVKGHLAFLLEQLVGNVLLLFGEVIGICLLVVHDAVDEPVGTKENRVACSTDR